MAEGKDVELRIRARDYSQKTLDQVTKSLEDLAKAQDEQLDAAKKGEVSASELKATYTQLEAAYATLTKRLANIKTFENQSAALAEVEKKLQAAREEQKAYVDTLKAGEERTDKQNAKLNKLAKAVSNAEGAQQRAKDRLAETAEQLEKYGIATTEVVQAQQRITTSMTQTSAALDRQGDAISDFDGDMRRLRESTAAAARAETEFQASIQSVAAAQAKAAQDAAKFEAERNNTAAQNKRIAYERLWIDLLEEEDRKNAELARSKKELADFDAAMAAQRQKERAAQLQAMEDAEKERRALKALGDQLAQTAKGYQKIAAASATTTGGGTSSLAQSLKDIADPAAAALRSINGVEQSLAGLTQRVSQIRGPVKDAQGLLNGLADAQKAAVAIAGQIDGYQKQVRALRESRAEFVNARAAVAELVRQLQAGTGGDDIISKIAKAERNLEAASEAMGNQVERTRALREALRAAGVQTNDLAGTQQRLVKTTETATKALDQTTAAIKKNGAAKEELTNKIRLFNQGERTTLSYMQRLRGEAIALGTAFIGINAAVAGTGEVLNVVRDMTKIQARFLAIFSGDSARATEELDYLKAAANRIGVSFRDSALEYTKFLAATKEAGWQVNETRFVFEQFAEAAVRTGQSKEEFRGIMLAITQMVSKGKIGAEELTQQLAERLPGAVAKMANELKISVPELLRQMEASAVTARAVINLAQGMMKDNANALLSAGAEMIRAEGRLQTAKDEFALAIADSGFTKAYTEFLQRLTALLQSEDGKKLAQSLGGALTVIADIMVLLVENFDAVKAVFIGLVGLKIAVWIGTVGRAVAALAGNAKEVTGAVVDAVKAFMKMGGEAGTTTTKVGKFNSVLMKLGKAIPVVGSLFAVFEIGSGLIDLATAAWRRFNKERGGTNDAGDWEMPPDPSKPGNTATPDPGTGMGKGDLVFNEMQKALEKGQKDLDEADRSARMKGAKQTLAERQKIATEELMAMRERAQKEITNEQQKAETIARIDKQIQQARLIEKRKFENEMGAATQGRVNKEAQLIQDIGREMMAVEDRLKNQETKLDPLATFEQRMKARMAAIAHEYDGLMSKISKLEKMNPKAAVDANGVKLSDKLKGYIQDRQNLEAIKVKTEELQRLEKNLADVQALKTAKLEEQKALWEGGVISLDTYRQRVADINETFGMGIEKAIDLMRDFAQNFGKEFLDPSALDALMTRLNTAAASNRPQRDNAQANVSNAEQDLNITLERRKLLLEEVQRLKELGLITDDQAVAKINAINGAYRAQILEQTTALLAYIDILRGQIDPSNEQALLQLDQLRAKIAGVKLETEMAKQAFTGFEQTVINAAVGALQTSLNGIVDIFEKIITGQQTASEGFKSLTKVVLMGFAQMLKEAALYIIKLQIIKALKSSGNPITVAIGTAMEGSAGKKHTGGLAGSPSGSAARFALAMPQAIPKMHQGGVVGLKNDEVLRVLQKNEEVVTRNDPRHVLNGGTQGGGGAMAGARFVLVDDRSKVPEAMASAQGDQVSLEFVRRNRATIKSMLG